jgi:hypothetical protein
VYHSDATLAKSVSVESRRSLFVWGALLAAANFLAVIWHVTLLVKVQPSFPEFAIALLLLVNLIPACGVLAFVRGFRKSAAAMMMIPLGAALLIGGYTHFLSPGSDNVLRMPSGELTFAFQSSAILLVVLEGLGCWIGVRFLNCK